MRALFGLPTAALLALAFAPDARAQWVYPGGAPYVYQYGGYAAAPPVYARPYAFKNEPLMSINNSYLGYGNLVDVSGRPPAPGYVTRYGQAVNQGYVPARGGFRWFGRRRGYGY